MALDRYSLQEVAGDNVMVPRIKGDFILYADYEAEKVRLAEENMRLRDALEEIEQLLDRALMRG
jgi:hypothetical protein